MFEGDWLKAAIEQPIEWQIEIVPDADLITHGSRRVDPFGVSVNWHQLR